MTREKELELVDRILDSYNEAWTGEQIRERLEKEGFVVCKMEKGQVHSGCCPTCGCEPLHGQEP